MRRRALAAARLDRRQSLPSGGVISLRQLEPLLEAVDADPAHADYGFDAGLHLAAFSRAFSEMAGCSPSLCRGGE
ncbi:hypothetical protein [Acidimangrovimonas pyrenivorans]|uniref:HTH araC/xylS-type domain-containing protein n=1 Tax=Acidimangrovimonas pyrenivorans TaxID=2030798 RepID=A0ABV7AG92_9RHOB